MRAVIVKSPGSESVFVGEVAIPSPAAGEALVKAAFAGCNFADTMMRSGTYPHPKGYPLVAGCEVAGTVIALGSGVKNVAIGDRVVGFSEAAGCFAEYCAVPAARLAKLPDSVGFDVAAAFFIQAVSAWHMLHTASSIARGETVLVNAIGGGVGLYLTQMAAAAGAKVIGTVGTRGKERRALEYGAAKVINRGDEDFVAAVLNYTGGKGVDKIIDSTGGSVLDRSFETIRPLGHVVSYGEAEGKPFPNLWERLVAKSLTFTRLHIGHVDPASPAWKNGVSDVFGKVLSGRLAVPIEGVFALKNVNDMYARLQSRQVAGKLILEIGA
jgi:NADPH2:quinone reductase